MNPLLDTYLTALSAEPVDGATTLQLLHLRERLTSSDISLSGEDHRALYHADQYLLLHAATYYHALAQVIDLVAYRTEHIVDPDHWWWFLEIVQGLPLRETLPPLQPYRR